MATTVELVQNSDMSIYEKLLTYGQYLQEEERFSLYRYLLDTKKKDFEIIAKELVNTGTAVTSIANGKIIFTFCNNRLTYSVSKLGDDYVYESVRELRINNISLRRKARISKFIAQAEVDVIWNFPVPSEVVQTQRGFSIWGFAFYDPRFFAQGKSKVIGMMKSLFVKDTETLLKLRAL